VRRILASDQDPERRLEELLAERRRDLDEQAARLQEALRDLERREQALRDSRASIERLLRLGTSDLDSREAELNGLLEDVTAREERLRTGEADLARRREELGAVELKRAAVERRERAVAAREEAVALRDTGAEPESEERSTELSPTLFFVPGETYRLRELEHARLRCGQVVVLDGEDFVVARTGPSPLPRDGRRCAYLVRGPRRGASSDGSS
jgi:hypothetical protein